MALSAGTFSGFVNAVWLQELERLLPGKENSAVAMKTTIDYFFARSLLQSGKLVFVPFMAAAFAGMPLGADHFLDGWTPEKFVSAMELALCTFTLYNAFAFRVLPLQVRPYLSAVVSAFNTIIISGISRQ